MVAPATFPDANGAENSLTTPIPPLGAERVPGSEVCTGGSEVSAANQAHQGTDDALRTEGTTPTIIPDVQRSERGLPVVLGDRLATLPCHSLIRMRVEAEGVRSTLDWCGSATATHPLRAASSLVPGSVRSGSRIRGPNSGPPGDPGIRPPPRGCARAHPRRAGPRGDPPGDPVPERSRRCRGAGHCHTSRTDRLRESVHGALVITRVDTSRPVTLAVRSINRRSGGCTCWRCIM